MTDYADRITRTLDRFSVAAKIVDTTRGPMVTRYALDLGPGVKVSTFTALAKDMNLGLGVDVRLIERIPGTTHVGIEVPNDERDMVLLGDVFRAEKLAITVGVDVDSNPVTIDLEAMPHLLVAGTTGSGKSAFLNALLVSLLHVSSDHVRLALIDPKQVEMASYGNVPHLYAPIATEPHDAIALLEDLCAEMDDRYRTLRNLGVRHAGSLADEAMPRIVVVVDELADLMLTGDKAIVEKLIVRLAQKGRAAGIHLVLATQRPTVDVVTGLIKANVPSRVAFTVATGVDSRVVLDQNGAESLTGKGDGLFLPVGAKIPVRFQCAWVSDDDIRRVTESI